jgi:hypothetical protein
LKNIFQILLLVTFTVVSINTLNATGKMKTQANTTKQSASDYLAKIMDQFHNTVDVYTDYQAAGNHFVARGRMSNTGGESALPPMNEACTDTPHSGINCIRCDYLSSLGGASWGGWYFMNGVLGNRDSVPKENWGDSSNAGIDLRGATRLTFWARGAKGGEQVEFFCFGVGRDANSGAPNKPFPDSSPKISAYVTLSTEWREYTVGLSGRDLSYVLGGFGWVATWTDNRRDITFYIDDIQYNKVRLNEPRFFVSYETKNSALDFDKIMRDVAFTYDQAVALIAFIASGDSVRAKLLADALIYAQGHDRMFDDGRIRNAYQGGDLILFPGWTPNGKIGTARLPNLYIALNANTGTIAWAMLALITYYERYGENQYLTAAQKIGQWVEDHCRDGRSAGGYSAGREGWDKDSIILTYKATEHNIDLYAAYKRLYHISVRNNSIDSSTWNDRANHAKQFVLAMWDSIGGKFWTGTTSDGITINKDVIPLDIQPWAILALKSEGRPYWKALEYAEIHQKVGDGFDFNDDCDGVWYEGTAHMAIAYYFTGQTAKENSLLQYLHTMQDTSGGLPEADKDSLTTGLDWRCFHRLRGGTTAWLMLAEKMINPFWMDTSIITGVNEHENQTPEKYILYQNYPNPCNPSSIICFALPTAVNVKMVIIDLLGREIAVLVNDRLDAGEHRVQWKPSGLSSGLYFYQLRAGEFVETKKLLLLK